MVIKYSGADALFNMFWCLERAVCICTLVHCCLIFLMGVVSTTVLEFGVVR